MKTEMEMVREFMALFDVECHDEGTQRADMAPERVALNKSICTEEIRETLEQGLIPQDRVKLADGVGDSVYVLAHARNQLGLAPDAGRDDAAKILISLALEKVEKALGETPIGHSTLVTNLAYAEIIVRGIAATYGIPFEAVFNEIHRSNMTKTWDDGKGRKNELGKVMKPPGYTPPDIEGVLKEHEED